jgi:hypothetical protein
MAGPAPPSSVRIQRRHKVHTPYRDGNAPPAAEKPSLSGEAGHGPSLACASASSSATGLRWPSEGSREPARRPGRPRRRRPPNIASQETRRPDVAASAASSFTSPAPMPPSAKNGKTTLHPRASRAAYRRRRPASNAACARRCRGAECQPLGIPRPHTNAIATKAIAARRLPERQKIIIANHEPELVHG